VVGNEPDSFVSDSERHRGEEFLDPGPNRGIEASGFLAGNGLRAGR
jgi:hypothetical protein